MTMIQIRNVSEDVHRELKLRATAAGMTLSDYLKDRLAEMLLRTSPDEWVRNLPTSGRTTSSEDIASLVREMRDAR